MGLPEYQGGIYTAKLKEAYTDGKIYCYKLTFEEEATKRFGLPYFWVEKTGQHLEIKWFGKKPSRLPQAFWLKLNGMNEDWEIHKLGQWISPGDIIGSPLITAVDTGVRNTNLQIECLDAVLVAPFGRCLLDYDLHPERQDMYFNLYNNIWNTNFPMWYSEDSRFRFCVQDMR